MKKRTEILAISLVLTGSAIAAALMSGPDNAADLAPVEAAGAAEPAPAAEPGLRPVVYDVDIPMDVLNDGPTAAPQADDEGTG